MAMAVSLQFDKIMLFIRKTDPGLAKIIVACSSKVDDVTLIKVMEIIKKSPHFPPPEKLKEFTTKFINYQSLKDWGKVFKNTVVQGVVDGIFRGGRRSRL